MSRKRLFGTLEQAPPAARVSAAAAAPSPIAARFGDAVAELRGQAVRQTGPDGRETVTVHGSPAIRSPGGYLRALTQKGKQEPFTLWSAILGQLSQKAKVGRSRSRGSEDRRAILEI